MAENHDDGFTPEQFERRFDIIADRLFDQLARNRDLPVVEFVIPHGPLRTLRDLDRAMAGVELTLRATLFDPVETRAIAVFRTSVKRDFKRGAATDEMELHYALRDGRMSYEDLGTFGRQITIRPTVPSARPPSGRPEQRAPLVKPTPTRTTPASTTPERLGPRNGPWSPEDIAARCIKRPGVRVELQVADEVALHMEKRLIEMGLRVEMTRIESPRRRRRRPHILYTLAAWLDLPQR